MEAERLFSPKKIVKNEDKDFKVKKADDVFFPAGHNFYPLLHVHLLRCSSMPTERAPFGCGDVCVKTGRNKGRINGEARNDESSQSIYC